MSILEVRISGEIWTQKSFGHSVFECWFWWKFGVNENVKERKKMFHIFLLFSASACLAKAEIAGDVTRNRLPLGLFPPNSKSSFGLSQSSSPSFTGQQLPANLRVTNLPNFVGFSYSRAAPNPPDRRFISFLQEVSHNLHLIKRTFESPLLALQNVNVNANFLPTFGSFECQRPGIYFFTFSFMTNKNDAAM